MDKPILNKESWDNLSDEEKNIELSKMFKGMTYDEYLADYERLQELNSEYRDLSKYGAYEAPVLELELVDHKMTHSLISWMFQQGDKLDQIPLLGYRLKTIWNSKEAFYGYSESEKEIINKAFEILKDHQYCFNNSEIGIFEVFENIIFKRIGEDQE
ncbi:MAG: hypothetical protein J1F35_05715 [Erysipelotrichales bacterium]|nr:hypothetical protein [Erysipelotrichales bacterium]